VPELPEVETIRRQLAPELTGHTVVAARVARARLVRAHACAADFTCAVVGRRILAVTRRGKALLLPLDDGHTLLIRLGMSGQVLLAAPGDPLRPHTHIIFTLDDGRELRFVDPRTFGQAAIIAGHDPAQMAELAHYGAEPLADDFTPAVLRTVLRGTPPVEAAIMDQTRVVGVGKIYADEACFHAGIDPRRSAKDITDAEVVRLHAAIREVLSNAILARGTSFADAAYRDARGALGGFQQQIYVYGRSGQPCRVCATPIETAPLQGRRMHYCPKCQK
jgi:formamidopyrimidine-DNA glycosylase